MPQNIQEHFSMHFVETMDEVLKIALQREISVIKEKEDKKIKEYKPSMEEDFSQESESITH